MRVVIVGGGYAGMAALVSLRQRVPEAELHLVDPGFHHLKVTHLQQTLGRPLAQYRLAFADLAKRFAFTHHRLALPIDAASLLAWQDHRTVPLPGGPLRFDYAVIATGSRPRPAPKGQGVYDQRDFARLGGQDIIAAYLERTRPLERSISLVGAGPTGLQFLFELHTLLAEQGVHCRLRLLDSRSRLLPNLPQGFDRRLRKRLATRGIEYLPDTRYLGQHGDFIEVRDIRAAREYRLPSSLTLLFAGVAPHPCELHANRYGRLRVGDRVLWNIFAAGDCARFDGPGLNTLTAQAAVRKGKQVAANIRRIHQGRWPHFYTHTEQGFLISLGPRDGIGWLLFKPNLVTGLPAVIAKEAVEKQWDWFLEGIDTFF
jgi:NADH dehydrogenase